MARVNFDKRVLSILEDQSTYLPLKKSNQTQIEKQAIKILNGIGKNKYTKAEREKLLSTGSQPAAFQAFIKDYKVKSPLGFRLRPIAFVRNTATEKVDWLVSSILTSLVQFCPANVRNTEEVIDIQKSLNKENMTAESTFISLDVVNLYPSITLDMGIKYVIE